MKRFGFLGGALVLSASMAACTGNGDDSSATAPPIDSGGPGVDASVPGEAGEDANPPEGDATTTPEASMDAASQADGSSDSSPGEAGTEGAALDAGDASTRSYAIFVGTDFTNAELAAVALGPDEVAGQLPLDDQDSVPYASGGFGFVMEHTVGKILVLDRSRPWMATKTIDINDGPDSGAYASNPRAVLVTTGTKAYVARYASNVIKVVDVASGAVTGSIDLSAFVAPDDTDGLVDVQDAAYDPASGHAYFLLQRINQFDFSGSAPDFVAACLTSHGAIVGVDVAQDTILDLNGDAAAGQAIELLGDNPGSLTLDASGRLIVPETGCYQPPDPAPDGGSAPRVGRGVEAVSLAAGTATWLYQTDVLDRLSGLVWVDGTHAFVEQGFDWLAWNPTQTTIGRVVPNFPQAPVSDGHGRIVGLAYGKPYDEGPEAGSVWTVVALDIASSQVTTIGPNPFQSVVPSSGYGVAGALLH